MRISHRELAQCQINPTEWVSNRVNQNEKFYRTGYKRCLLEEIYSFHKHENVKKARQYLQERLRKQKLKDYSRIQETLARLNAYMSWYQCEGIMTVKSPARLNFGLGHGIILGGHISRVDITTNGFRAILFESIPLRWYEELRMPLIQRGLGLVYGRSEDKFVVGIQELDTCALVETSYSTAAMNDAEQTARQLAEDMAKVADEVDEYTHTQLRLPI